MKLATIIGARPQFVKAAALSREIKKFAEISEVIIHTGQHYDNNMSNIFFEQMNIPKPNYNLNINGLNHGAMTGQMLEKIEEILLIETPDWVVVYGDTNSTLAGALAAKKQHIKVAHIEAGLRSYNMIMPEEINRILTDRISDILFCPTKTAIQNLNKEGYENLNNRIVLSGDIMYDAALFYSQREQKPLFSLPPKFILTTIHRAENTDNNSRLLSIINSLNTIAETTPIILPLHPRTAKMIKSLDIKSDKLTIVNPIGYLEMIYMLKRCQLVMTDSGGLQKEAFFFHKECITLRDETEWIELVSNGYNRLVGADSNRILEAIKTQNKDLSFKKNLFGNGETAKKILNQLLNY